MTQANTSQREHTAESIIGKENLLITIGDSWTWGDSLGSTTLEFNDKQTRHKQFYTNLLAKKLEADWIMLAQANLDKLSEQIKELKRQYYLVFGIMGLIMVLACFLAVRIIGSTYEKKL